jgi:AcrR family transcriptional regulator
LVRSLNPTIHAVRRDAILDVAERLIRTSGYEQMSIQDIQNELDASRGAIYHYFGSKADILEAVIERMTTTVMVVIEPVTASHDLSPLEKLQRVFVVASQWKIERRELMLAVAQAWYSDHNALVRDRLRTVVTAHLTPLIAEILREGKAHGDFAMSSADHAAAILVGLLLDTGEAVKDLLFAHRAGGVSFQEAEEFVAAYNEAFERILGVSPGSFQMIDSRTLHMWFD